MPATRDTGGPRKRRRKRPASTPTSRARAQGQQYVSQGRAVERAANRQRAAAAPRPQGPRQFEPFLRDHGLQRAQRQQVNRARRAESKLPDSPAIPHVPVLKNGYTPRQRQAIRRIYRSAAKRAGAKSVTELYRSGSPAQRQQMRRVGRIVTFGSAQALDLRPLREHNLRDTVSVPESSGRTVLGLKTAGPSGSLSLGDVGSIAKSLFNVGRAFYEDPAQTSATSLRVGRESITGIPQQIKTLTSDPMKGLEELAKDYEARYGSINKNPKAFRERVKTEWGLTPFAFDAATAATGVGLGAGAVARTGSFARLARAMSEAPRHPELRLLGRAGQRAHQAAATERPALRFSAGRNDEAMVAEAEASAKIDELEAQLAKAKPGTPTYEKGRKMVERLYDEVAQHRAAQARAGATPQPRARNLFKALGQDVLDRRRARWLEAEKAKPEKKRALNLEVKPGEVTPITTGVAGRSLREAGVLRRYTGRVARGMGGRQSVSRLRILTLSGRVGGEMRKKINRLNGHEKIVVREMAELGVGADKAGIRALRLRLEKIEPDSPDAVAIRQILDDPEKHLTQRARDVVDELRDIQLEHAARDPRLVPDQEIIRRLTPQADLLGEKRRPDVGYFRGVLADIEAETGARGLTAYADRLAKADPGRERRELARSLVNDVKSQRGAAERDVQTAERRLSAAQERQRTPTPVTTPEVREARQALATATAERARLKGELKGRRGEHQTVRGVKYGGDFRIKDLREQLHGPEGRIYYRGGNPGETPKSTGFEDWDRSLFMSHDPKIAGLYGDTLERIVVKPNAKIVEAGTPEFEALRKRAKAGPMQAVLISRQARKEGIDVVDFKRSEMGAIVLNPKAVIRDAPTGLEDQIKELRQRVRRAEADAPRHTPAQARRVERARLTLATRKTTLEHLETFEKSMIQAHRATQAKQHMRLEGADEFAGRVRAAAAEAGLHEPAYWMGVLEGDLDVGRAGMKASGRGVRATGKPKRSEAKLSRAGKGERDPEVLVKGVEANIKRRFQYDLVTRNIETHAFEWSRMHGAGMRVDQLKRYLKRHGIDPDSVELLDTRILTRRDRNLPDAGHGEDPVSSFAAEMGDYRKPGSIVTRADYKDLAHNRYLAFPREVAETLDGVASKMDSTGFRMAEVLLKQKPARIMLGLANIPWLGFQIASNAILTGLGGGLNPFDIYGAAKWWKGLDAEARDALEAELGITHGHHFAMDQVNLGETNKRYVAAWRGFKQTKAMRVGHRMNPLDAMFRADEAQNNFFRRTLFYSKAKRDAYRRMGSDVRGIARGMDKLMENVLGKDPARMGQAIAQHGPEFEQVAKHVKSWLGDYLSFTPAERFLLSRHVMFYGYLRFSLRFTFYTMPIGHPIMATILSDVGRAGAQEIKELFGVPRGYNLQPSMLAQAYSGTRADAKHGTLRAVNFGRMNPFLNAITQMGDLSQSAGLVSPIYQAFLDQAFKESSFTGRDWTVRGEPLPASAERPSNYYTNTDRARIFAGTIAGLAYPYRAASDILMEPNQTDDALLGSPRPTQYAKGGDAAKGIAKARREFRRTPLSEKFSRNLLPILSRPTQAPAVIERELQKRADYANRRRGKRKKRRKRKRSGNSFGGSSGGNSFGGSSGGNTFGG